MWTPLQSITIVKNLNFGSRIAGLIFKKTENLTVLKF